jgi:hypothetical protein
MFILLLLVGLGQLPGKLFTRLRRLNPWEKYWLASLLVVQAARDLGCSVVKSCRLRRGPFGGAFRLLD